MDANPRLPDSSYLFLVKSVLFPVRFIGTLDLFSGLHAFLLWFLHKLCVKWPGVEPDKRNLR
jgi:hypothetical protein